MLVHRDMVRLGQVRTRPVIVIQCATSHVRKAGADMDTVAHIIHHLHLDIKIMAGRAMPPPVHVQSHHKHVIPRVHLSQIAKHTAGQNRVPVRAAFQMVHVHTAVQPVHLPILVTAILPVVVVIRRVSHVRDVMYGYTRQPAHVRAEQSASHAMRVIIC